MTYNLDTCGKVKNNFIIDWKCCNKSPNTSLPIPLIARPALYAELYKIPNNNGLENKLIVVIRNDGAVATTTPRFQFMNASDDQPLNAQQIAEASYSYLDTLFVSDNYAYLGVLQPGDYFVFTIDITHSLEEGSEYIKTLLGTSMYVLVEESGARSNTQSI